MAPRLTLGINSCFALKRWPEPAEWLAVVTDRLGLTACQVSLDLFDPGLEPAATKFYADQLAEAAETAGVFLHSTFTGIGAYAGNLLLHPEPEARAAAERWFGRAITLSASVGARGTGGFLGAMSVSDATDPEGRLELESDLAGAMQRLAEVASEHHLEFLLFENMAVERELGHSIEEARRMERWSGTSVPWRLCLDLGHPCALPDTNESADPLAWLRVPWLRTPVLQIQQANRDGDFHWPFTEERNRAGLLEAEPVVEAIRSWHTDEEVFLFLEVIHPHEYPDELVIEELAASVDYWRQAVERAA